MLQANNARAPNPEFSRFYVSHCDPELLVQDLEFEDLAAHDAFWEEWQKGPEHAAIAKAYGELGIEHTDTDYWTVV